MRGLARASAALRAGLGLLVLLAGCATGTYAPAPPLPSGAACNPLFVPSANFDALWETTVDVVDDYFRIEHEERVRPIGNMLVEGRIDTHPTLGATLLEPWHADSANLAERTEATLQSIRRQAVVRVIPDAASRGAWIEVVVHKELEDVVHPEHATAGAATLRYDNSMTRVVDPIGSQEVNRGWIPQGRDGALEQRMLAQLQGRLRGAGQPLVTR